MDMHDRRIERIGDVDPGDGFFRGDDPVLPARLRDVVPEIGTIAGPTQNIDWNLACEHHALPGVAPIRIDAVDAPSNDLPRYRAFDPSLFRISVMP